MMAEIIPENARVAIPFACISGAVNRMLNSECECYY